MNSDLARIIVCVVALWQVAAATAVDIDRNASMMEQARQAFVNGELDRAVSLYTHLADAPNFDRRADALEFLGVTRQRKGQLAQAKAAFDRYLRQFPGGAGRARVQQRLAALTAPPGATSRSAQSNPGTPRAARWSVYGSHSSYMRRNTVSVGDNADVTNLSMWQGDVDVIARRRGTGLDVFSRFTAGHRADFARLGRDRGGLVVTNAYLDLSAQDRGLRTRLGRQSRTSGGIYGRFDGAYLGWDWTPNVTLNAAAGLPVQRRHSRLDTERSMYGLSADWRAARDALKLTLFANNHTVDGVADRRGIGGEFRYAEGGRNIFGLLDYDALYASLNASMLGFSWTTPGRLNLHGNIDYRRSPLLSTTNAIIGQGVTSIEELEATFTEDELQALAEDNTATSTSASLGMSWPLSSRFQLSASIQRNELETAVNFAQFAGASGTNTTLSLHTQLVASSWWRQSDAWIVGLRLSDGDTFKTSSLSVNSRLPVTSHLRLNPFLRVTWRQNQLSRTDEWIVTPGLRLQLRWRRHFVLEGEIRGDTSQRATLAGDMTRSSYYYSVGYRADFGR